MGYLCNTYHISFNWVCRAAVRLAIVAFVLTGASDIHAFLFSNRIVVARMTSDRELGSTLPITLMLVADKGFVLVDLENPTQKHVIDRRHIFIVGKQGMVFVEGKKLAKKKVAIFSREGPIFLSAYQLAQRFDGPVMLSHDEGVWELVHYEERSKAVMKIAESVIAEYAGPLYTGDSGVAKSSVLEQLQALEMQRVTARRTKKRIWDVRVLLDTHEGKHGEQKSWHMQSEKGFRLGVLGATAKKRRRHGKRLPDEVLISCNQDGITVQGQCYKQGGFCMSPNNGQFTCNGKTYNGELHVIMHKDNWLLINCLDLETYVASVLHSESWPGWPLEVNKAFAVASRTYAIAMMFAARAAGAPYHLQDTNKHQTYRGVHANVLLYDAVASTKGIFLAYKKKPIMAMFDSCCGGIIPSAIGHVDFSWAPYLARTEPCTFCKKSKIYRWEALYTRQQLAAILNKAGYPLTDLHDIKIVKKDAAGLATSVACTGASGRYLLSGKKVYSLLKKVKSFWYTIRKKGDCFIFSGKGYGHHLGLCQWGAREMVRQGWDYRQILSFYYPHAGCMRLTDHVAVPC